MVHILTDALAFPAPERANPGGLVAVGGDTSAERLLLAYGQGIFPWPSPGSPLLWFSPDPRFVLRTRDIKISRSLRKVIRRGTYEVRFDSHFEYIMRACAAVPRPGQNGTWITQQLVDGYLSLHKLGYAHSVGAYEDGRLVGGLYGVSLGKAFFGESMFTTRPDASKVAFVTLVGNLAHWGIDLVDCQVYTDHLSRFGAEEWPRDRFLAALRSRVAHPTRIGKWHTELDPIAALETLTGNANQT